jgi:hypothetical protein
MEPIVQAPLSAEQGLRRVTAPSACPAELRPGGSAGGAWTSRRRVDQPAARRSAGGASISRRRVDQLEEVVAGVAPPVDGLAVDEVDEDDEVDESEGAGVDVPEDPPSDPVDAGVAVEGVDSAGFEADPPERLSVL